MSTTTSDVIYAHIATELVDLYTSFPATVTDVSKLESENKVSVQPAVDIVNDDGEVFAFPILEDKPIQWPAGGGAVMTFPIAVGDDVTVNFSMFSVAEFQASESGTVQPFDDRLHSLSDAYIVPSIFRNSNNPAPNPTDVEIKFQDGKFRLTEESTAEFDVKEFFSVTNTSGELIALINDLAAQVSAITVNTVNGPTPINNKIAVDNIIADLITFKKV